MTIKQIQHKATETREQLTQAEKRAGELASVAWMLTDRRAFLELERRGLAWPLSQGDKSAGARAAAIDTELTDLATREGATKQEQAETETQLSGLRSEISALELQALAAKRNQAALLAVEAELSVLDVLGALARAREAAEPLHAAALDLDAQLLEAGIKGQPDFSTIPGGDDRKRSFLSQQAELLKAALK